MLRSRILGVFPRGYFKRVKEGIKEAEAKDDIDLGINRDKKASLLSKLLNPHLMDNEGFMKIIICCTIIGGISWLGLTLSPNPVPGSPTPWPTPEPRDLKHVVFPIKSSLSLNRTPSPIPDDPPHT